MPSYSDIIQQATELLRQGKTMDATTLFEQLLEAVPGDPIALEFLGVQAIRAGDYDKAVALLSKAVTHPRHRDTAVFQLGHAYRDSGDLESAARTYKQYTTVQTDPGGSISLADVYFDLEKPDEAAKALKKALSSQPDNVKALALLARAQTQLGLTKEAKDSRRKAMDAPGSDEDARMIKASIWLDLDEPQKAFSEIEGIANSAYGDALNDLCRSYSPDRAAKTLPRVQGVLPQDSDSPLILAAGSPAYMKRYGPELVHSVAAYSPDSQVHLHIVSQAPLETAPNLDVESSSCTVSWEHESKATKTTYATRRFVRLPQWRRLISQPIVVVDLDSQVRASVSAALSHLPPFDVAMRYRDQEIFIKQRVAAGFLALASTLEATYFIDCVAAYILHFEANGTAQWFVDQLALLAARCHAQSGLPVEQIRITDIPPSYLDWGHLNPDSLVWTTKGVRKTLPPLT